MEAAEGWVGRFIDGVAAADPRAIAASLAPDARLRALIPPGLREREGAAEAAELIASWFADADPLVLVASGTSAVGPKVHFWYRVDGTEEGQDFVMEQQVFAEVTDAGLTNLMLLCSGSQPRTGTTSGDSGASA